MVELSKQVLSNMSQPNNTLTKHVITQNPQKAVVSPEQLRIQELEELITEHKQKIEEKEPICSQNWKKN